MTKKRIKMYVSHVKEAYENLETLQHDVEAVTPKHLLGQGYSFTGCLEVVDGGMFICYYNEVKEFYKENGYQFQEKWSDSAIWETYKIEMAQIIWLLCRKSIEW